jgi:hypothetical protein
MISFLLFVARRNLSVHLDRHSFHFVSPHEVVGNASEFIPSIHGYSLRRFLLCPLHMVKRDRRSLQLQLEHLVMSIELKLLGGWARLLDEQESLSSAVTNFRHLPLPLGLVIRYLPNRSVWFSGT